MLLDDVKAILYDYCGLKPGQKLIAGVSGGVDSIVLLDLLAKVDFTIIVAHLDHQIRPSSGQEAEFVRETARRYGLDFITKSENIAAQAVERGESLEEAARNARYQFLFAVAAEKEAIAVVVAHQADDQVETILMHLLRGAGLNGLAGMQYRSLSAYHPEIPLIRPLLDCWREDILAYSRQEKLDYVTDESNQDTTYRRNRIRLELIPKLEEYNPRIKESLLGMAKLLGADKEFLDAYIAETCEQVCLKEEWEYVEIDIKRFREYTPAVQRYLVKWLLNNFFPADKDFGAIHFENTRRVIAREMPALNLQLNDRVVVRVENERAVLMTVERSTQPTDAWPYLDREKRVAKIAGEYAVSKEWALVLEILPREDVGRDYLTNPDPYRAYLDLNQLAPELELRFWQPGDHYQPLGMGTGTVKLSDFWVDHKIPRRAKQHWPLVFSGEELVWIPGFQPSRRACIKDETREILILKLVRKEA